VEIFAEILGTPARREWMSTDASLVELGADEADVVRVIHLLAKRLDTSVRTADLYRVSVLAAAVEAAVHRQQGPDRSAAAATPDVSLLPIKTTGAHPPLFCVHPASGSIYTYPALGRLLPSDQPVYAFEAAGLEDDGRQPARSIDELASRYVDLLATVERRKPVRLLGWSMGGVVVFEMARRLEAAGVEVDLLVVVDAPAPGGLAPATEAEMVHEFVEHLAGRSTAQPGTMPAVNGPAVGEDGALELIDDLIAQKRGNGLLPDDLDSAELRRRYTVFRSNVQAAAGYRSSWRFPGRLLAIRAAESQSLRSVWTGFAASVDEHEVPGNHYSIWDAEHLPRLSRILQDRIDEPMAVASRESVPSPAGS
jgi:thioesterase domain-containing protein